MKPGPLTFTPASGVAEALDLLDRHGDEAKIIAGGQSLLPLMNLRLARPAHLVDVNAIAGLDAVQQSAEGLSIGALTRHLTVERVGLTGPWAALADAMPLVGHHPIRVRGTFGGSVSHADPTAELPLVAVTLGAELEVRSARGARSIPAVDFFHGPFESDVQPDEMLTGARFPAPPEGAASAFAEFAERSGDFALASVCAAAAVDENGICTWARVGLGAVAPTPMRVAAVESVLVGARLDDAVLREAGRVARDACSPSGDVAASGEFKQELVELLTVRTLRSVAERLGRPVT